MKQEIMTKDRLFASLSIPDLTNPKNGIHAINIALVNIKKTIKTQYKNTPIEEIRTNPEISVKDNFDDLLFPLDNVSRSSRYTRYVTRTTVLRTHASATIPNWLKKTERDKLNDIIIVLPAMCYRRDVVDRAHSGEHHQMDVWRIKRGKPLFNRLDLIQLFETVLDSTIPGYEYRINETQHPYTVNGVEIEVLVNGEWVEVLECGEVNPEIIKNAGMNPQEYSGLALGMGLDRLVMIRKGIDDIRILRSDNPKIKKQMSNLDKYIVVSNQPSTKRVLSYSTSTDKNEEDVCEMIRTELGPNIRYLEDIEYEEIPYDRLSDEAKNNLGINPRQKNIIATLTFRSIEESLPKKKVNEWIQILYPKLNEGEKGYYS